MSEPLSPQNKPYASEVEEGKNLLLVRLRPKQEPALL